MKTKQTTSIITEAQQYFAPRLNQTVWEWAEQNVNLPPTEAQIPGPYSTSLVPFVREPLEMICRSPVVTDITLMWAAQLTKTTLINVSNLYDIANAPRNILTVMPSLDLARSFSVTRWQPIARSCPPVAALISADRHAFKNTEQDFTNMFMHFVGSNSAANLSSRPVPRINQDETDKFKPATEKEASASELADQRCKTFANPKKLKTSTPTTETGIIYREFIKGDQREYFVPCPNCNEYIQLLMEQIKWPKELKTADGWDYEAVKRAARYECQKCGYPINDSHKTKMNRAGNWQAQNPNAPKSHVSYHLSSWYAPWVDCTFGNTAVKYLTAIKTFTMQNFDNSERGWPSRVEAKKLDWEKVATRREDYKLGQINKDVVLLTCFVDVQDSWLELFIWGWGEGTENWLIDHEIISGDPSKLESGVWETLAETLLKPRDLPLDWTFIDYGGHCGQQAIEFVKKMTRHRVYLHKGSTTESDPINGRVTWTKKPRTRLFLTGVGNGKRTAMSMLTTETIGPGYAHFPRNIDDEFFKQLCSEELRTKYAKGSPVEYWYQTRPRNEALDGLVGCYAGLKRINQGIFKRRVIEKKQRNAQKTKPKAKPTQPIPDLKKPTQPPTKKRTPRKRTPRKQRGSWMKG